MALRNKPLLVAFLFALAPLGCSAGGKSSGPGGGASGGTGGTGGAGGVVIGAGTGGQGVTVTRSNKCADGTLDDNEACDDGNAESNDGCASDCLHVETGFVCPEAGKPCHPYAKCGDGLVVFPEQCDDKNLAEGDGCSPSCKVELGYKCDGAPSTCVPTVCGDGHIEGSETCDDGNTTPFDGCSDKCQAEPKCTDSGCTSTCGDGLIIGEEECDDGNTVDGDGCSSTCVKEEGYECSQGEGCTDVNGECAMILPIVIRDFPESHSDFGVGCGTQVLGVAKPTLTANGKPELASAEGACIESATSYAQWYTTTASVNAEALRTIVLFPNGEGGYVNRLDNEGTRYQMPPPSSGIQWCSNSSNDCAACKPGYTTCYPTCTPWGDTNTQTCAQYDSGAPPTYVDGNPLFFPVDDNPGNLPKGADEDSVASIPEEVYGGGWKADPSGALRNFYFTSEIAYWFEYHTGDVANLTFTGDDDVWVFVNRRLAVDLGGLHVPTEGSFTMAADGSVSLVHGDPAAPVASTLADFGIEDGGVYEIKVFHAERKKTGSSFKLTLSGFNTARSECTPTCGDGIIAAGEQCDDGTENNTGGHNRCSADCTLGTYCGDGIVQPESEQCDDADPQKPANCSGCRIVIIR